MRKHKDSELLAAEPAAVPRRGRRVVGAASWALDGLPESRSGRPGVSLWSLSGNAVGRGAAGGPLSLMSVTVPSLPSLPSPLGAPAYMETCFPNVHAVQPQRLIFSSPAVDKHSV